MKNFIIALAVIISLVLSIKFIYDMGFRDGYNMAGLKAIYDSIK